MLFIQSFFSVGKFPKNIFEKLIDGEPFVNVTPLSRPMANKEKNMRVILHGNDDVMMDADKMMEKEIMEDKEKMDNKNKDMQTPANKHNNKENKNTHTNMNRNKNKNMPKEDADNMIIDKGTKRKMKGKEIPKSSINEMSNMNHIVEVIEKNEELGNAEFQDVNDEDERKANVEKFEKSMVRKIKLSDRPKAMIEEERSSKSLSLDEDQENSQLEKLTIEVYTLKQKTFFSNVSQPWYLCHQFLHYSILK